MPNYDYTCSGCELYLEAFQKINDEPLTLCPSCKKETLERGVGGGSATFRFMGEGFYVNDSKEESGGCGCKKNKTKCCSSKKEDV